MTTPTVLITMAGSGQRFQAAGYKVPKFMVEALGQSLFRWSLQSLNHFSEIGADYIFAMRREHQCEEFLQRETATLGIRGYRVVYLDAPTDGQATTALIAGQGLARPERPLLIYNIDTYVEADWLRPEDVGGRGWVPCFRAEGDHWSFAEATSAMRITAVAEKRRISPYATVGLYWFSSFSLYGALYAEHFSTVGPEAGEKYIAPMYNTLIRRGEVVMMKLVDPKAVHPLGTPQEVACFEAGTK